MKLAYTQKMGPISAGRPGPHYPNLKAWVDADQISSELPGVTWLYLLAKLGTKDDERKEEHGPIV